MKTAQEADLDLDEDLKTEVSQKLIGTKRLNSERSESIDDFKAKGEAAIKERNKAE